MPINSLVKCLFNFWTVMFQKTIHGQFVNNSWTFMFQKDDPFVFHPFIFGGSAAQNGGLSLFNTHSARPANYLKTKDLRKRHFWLKFLSQWKPLRLKALDEKSAQWFVHFPADPTLHTPPKLPLHTPPRNPTQCMLSCRICWPNPTHPTPLIIKL